MNSTNNKTSTNNIIIKRGKDFSCVYTIDKRIIHKIHKVVLISDVCFKTLEQNNAQFTLSLLHNETQFLPLNNYNYTITIFFNDDTSRELVRGKILLQA